MSVKSKYLIDSSFYSLVLKNHLNFTALDICDVVALDAHDAVALNAYDVVTLDTYDSVALDLLAFLFNVCQVL